MLLSDNVKKSLKRFEEIIPPHQLKQAKIAYALFEDLVLKGLANPPSYNLEPISTIPSHFRKKDKSFMPSLPDS